MSQKGEDRYGRVVETGDIVAANLGGYLFECSVIEVQSKVKYCHLKVVPILPNTGLPASYSQIIHDSRTCIVIGSNTQEVVGECL